MALGASGSTGSSGSSGPQGATGLPGSPGFQGDTGRPGAVGWTGQPGTNGVRGMRIVQYHLLSVNYCWPRVLMRSLDFKCSVTEVCRDTGWAKNSIASLNFYQEYLNLATSKCKSYSR